jgi:hypothetical protein
MDYKSNVPPAKEHVNDDGILVTHSGLWNYFRV